jgi:hypothetical protein
MDFDVDRAIAGAMENVPEDEKARFKKLQEDERAKLSIGNPNAIYALRAIQLAEGNLTWLEDKEDIDFEYDRMAEGYSLLGDYEKAADLARSPERKKEYAEIRDAQDTPDCPCPLTEKQGKHSVPVRTTLLIAGEKQLTRCSRCGHKRFI